MSAEFNREMRDALREDAQKLRDLGQPVDDPLFGEDCPTCGGSGDDPEDGDACRECDGSGLSWWEEDDADAPR